MAPRQPPDVAQYQATFLRLKNEFTYSKKSFNKLTFVAILTVFEVDINNFFQSVKRFSLYKFYEVMSGLDHGLAAF